MYQIFQNKFCLLKLNLKKKNAKNTSLPFFLVNIVSNASDNDMFFHYLSFTRKNKNIRNLKSTKIPH